MQDVTPEDSLEAPLASKHFKMKTHQGTRAAKGPNLWRREYVMQEASCPYRQPAWAWNFLHWRALHGL